MKTSIKEILGRENILEHDLRSPLDFIEVANRGIPKASLLNIQKDISVNLHQIADLVGMSERNLSRYKEKDLLPPAASESVLQIAQITEKGIELFGDSEKFSKWLHQPNTAMNGSQPVELLGSRYGAQLTLNILGRIEWGIYS